MSDICIPVVRPPLYFGEYNNCRMNLIFFLGIACLSLPETTTAKAAGNFLNHAILQSPHLQTFIQPIGQELVSVILHCVGKQERNSKCVNVREIIDLFIFFSFVSGGAVPHNNLAPHAEVMLALNKTCPDWTAQWLRVALENQKGPAATLQKEDFTRVLRERTNKIRLGEILKELSMQCRQKTGFL